MSLFEKELPGNPLCRQNCPRANSYVRLINAIVEECETAAEDALGSNIYQVIRKSLELRRDSGESEADIPSEEDMVIPTRQLYSKRVDSLTTKRDQALDELGNLTQNCIGPIHARGEDSIGRNVEVWICGSPIQKPGFARASAHIEVHDLNGPDTEPAS